MHYHSIQHGGYSWNQHQRARVEYFVFWQINYIWTHNWSQLFLMYMGTDLRYAVNPLIGHFRVAYCLCQNKSFWEKIPVEMHSTYRSIFMQIKLILRWKVLHEDSFGNGLLVRLKSCWINLLFFLFFFSGCLEVCCSKTIIGTFLHKTW